MRWLFHHAIVRCQPNPHPPTIKSSPTHPPSNLQPLTHHQILNHPPTIESSTTHPPSNLQPPTHHQILNHPPTIESSTTHPPSNLQPLTHHQILNHPPTIKSSTTHPPSNPQPPTHHQILNHPPTIKSSTTHPPSNPQPPTHHQILNHPPTIKSSTTHPPSLPAHTRARVTCSASFRSFLPHPSTPSSTTSCTRAVLATTYTWMLMRLREVTASPFTTVSTLHENDPESLSRLFFICRVYGMFLVGLWGVFGRFVGCFW